jgi:hypothetical protein
MSILLSYYLAFTVACTIGIIALIVVFYLYVGILYLTRKSQGNNALKVVQKEEERA